MLLLVSGAGQRPIGGQIGLEGERVGGGDLIQRRKAQAAAHDRAILATLEAAGDAAVPAAALARQTSIPPRTLTARLAGLRGRGLIVRRGERGPVWLTEAGRVEAGAGLAGLDVRPALDHALRLLPTEAHRAMLRLLLSGVVARWHLLSEYPSGWPSFIALGDTATGKTALAVAVCRVFGLDPVAAVRLVQRETPGSLFVRREQRPGGWTLTLAPLLAGPFVCLDELDKADGELRAAALHLLQGDAAAQVEGQRVQVRPLPYVCLNTGPEGLKGLPRAYVRRSVVLDTTPLEPLLADVDEAVRRLLVSGVLPRLALEQLRPPAAALPAEDRGWLREALMACLTPQGWKLTDAEALSRLALGRAALAGEQEMTRAAVATGFDYLTVTATLGHTRPGWAAPFREYLTKGQQAGAALLPDLATVAAEHVQVQAARRQHGTERERLALDLVEDRAGLVERLRQTAGRLDGRRVPAPFRAEAKGLRAGLLHLAEQAAASRSREALDQTNILAGERLARAAALEAEVCQAAQQTAEQAAAAKQVEAQRRAAAQQARQQARALQQARKRTEAEQRRQTAKRRRELAAAARRTRTKPGESVPAALERLGVVRPQRRTRQVQTGQVRRFLARTLGGDDPGPTWRTKTYTVLVDQAGRGWAPEHLSAWGTPEVRFVLAAAWLAEGLGEPPAELAAAIATEDRPFR